MEYLPEFLTVALVHLLAVISPGPDFAFVTRQSLSYSRPTAVYSALGVGLGILVHVTYSMVGIGWLISQSILLFTALRWLGAAYLIWIGWQALRAQPHNLNTRSGSRPQDLSPARAIWLGFLTNALNPKATLFFLALFTQVIRPTTPLFIQGLYGVEMSLATFAWFACLAVLLTHRAIQTRIARVQHWAERVMGAVLIALGLKIALSRE
ncbi:LysE family transporter [Candidatus Berkelbacteria bacterium]|nr:LysE family transporter [Candidatus Berkelbacteria bacterium]